jgi:protease-4
MPTNPPSDGPATNGSAPSPAAAKGQTPPSQIVIQPQTTALGRYGKLVLVLLVLTVLSLVGLQSRYEQYFSPPNKPQEKYHSLSEEAEKKIAIITVAGTIMGSDNFVKKQIDRVRDDESVVAVVLRIDSPGGTVTGSDYLYHHLNELREQEDRELPLVVSMGSMCASGGYYIAMAVGDREDVIFAEPTTWTGSIGVVIPHYDFSGLLAKYDVKDDSIASHQNKLMGSPTRELNAEERAEERKLLQNLVNISFERFKEIVRSGRPMLADDEALDKVATGEIFTAEQARELGLVDKVGFIEEAIERAAELANIETDDLRCIKYTEPATTLSELLSAQAPQPNVLRGDLQGLLNLTAPRAYYLCTWLPTILSNTAHLRQGL